jgi:hypothetical protein
MSKEDKNKKTQIRYDPGKQRLFFRKLFFWESPLLTTF